MLYLIVIVVSLLLTFYFSGTETAFISVNKVRVEVWHRQKSKAAKLLLRYIKNPERFLYGTLIGNNISNIAFASFATVFFNEYLDPKVTWILILIVSLLVGEIIPKTLFRSLADWVIRKVVYPLEFFYHLFYPIIFLISKVADFILKLFGQKSGELKRFFSQKDIEILLNESRNIIQPEKREEGIFVGKILNLKKLQVGEAMVPRTDIEAIPDTTTLQQLKKIFKKVEKNRLPVFHKNLDDILGIIFLKDLFLNPKGFEEILHPVMFVPKTKRALELLKEFRENNTTIAIVVDEYGGTSGLVTAEDLIEELFGEIEDEFDSQQDLIRQIDKNTFKVNARIEIQRLNQDLNVDFPEGNYETLAGFLLSNLGHIPKREEVFEHNEVKIIITNATRRKIRWVRIVLN